MLKYYRIRELASTPAREGRLPVSGSTIWRWVAEGKFPAPVKLNGTTAWPVEAIEAWEREHTTPTAQDIETMKKVAAASVAARRARQEAASGVSA